MNNRPEINLIASISLLLFGFSTVAQSDPIAFIANLDIVEADTGAGIYSGTPLGTTFSGYFDDVAFNGEITNGSIWTEFACCFDGEGLEIQNNITLESDAIAGLNLLAGAPIFTQGQILDAVFIGSDIALPGGGSRLIVLSYFYDADTYANESLVNFSFDPADSFFAIFALAEEDVFENTVYGGGKLLDIPPELPTGRSGAGETDALVSIGTSIDAGSTYTGTVGIADTVSINTLIQPDSAHVGADLNIVVAVEILASGEIFLFTNAGLVPYIPTNPFLFLATINDASAVNLLPLLRDFEVTAAEIGAYNIYAGYLVEGGEGDIYYSLGPAQLDVTGN